MEIILSPDHKKKAVKALENGMDTYMDTCGK